MASVQHEFSRTVNDQVTAQQSLVAATGESYHLSQTHHEKRGDSYQNALDSQQNLIIVRLARLINLVTLYKMLGGGSEQRLGILIGRKRDQLIRYKTGNLLILQVFIPRGDCSKKDTKNKWPISLKKSAILILAPQRGLEPRTRWLTVTLLKHFRPFQAPPPNPTKMT